MSGEIHEISSELGYLRSEAQAAREARARIYEKLDEISRKMGDIKGTVQTHGEVLGRIEPEHDELVRMKHKGLGFMACLSLLASGAGAGLVFLLKSINWSKLL